MTEAASNDRLRPRLVFRVGVTGHRDVPEDSARIREAVEACLTLVRDEVAGLAATPRVRGAYAPAAEGEAPFTLHIVSPLAAGADRIVARAGLALGAELYAPLPFPRVDYVNDFPDSADAFAALVDRAKVFELDGAHVGGAAQNESYEAVGRYVARNCDLLIAIWDGERAHGQGGAADIVAFAARAGMRIWWIHAKEDRPARLIHNFAEFRAPERAPAGEEARTQLATFLARELLPPEDETPERDGALGYLAAKWRALFAPDRSPLDEFFAETPRPRRAIWRTYALLMNLVAPAAPPKPVAEETLTGPWQTLLTAVDPLSEAYGDRYRSSYVLVALLVIVALATAAFGGEPELGWQRACVIGETVALFAICLLVIVNFAGRWHERWISYRLLAELARKQRVLALIGQSLPGADVTQLTDSAEKALRDAWIAWLFMAHRRACDGPTGPMVPPKRAAWKAGSALVDEQLAYHEGRRDRAKRAEARVRLVTEVFFAATIVVAVVKLVLLLRGETTLIHLIVFIAAAVSSIATAFVGIRAYAEFALLARQSRHMIRALEAARSELDSLAPALDDPLASLHLGRTLYAITTAMMHDITGWAHLFRAKALEAG